MHNKYLLQYKCDMQEKMENKDDYDGNVMQKCDTFVNSLGLDKKVMFSYCRDNKLNNKLSNRQVKQLIIGFYGEDISFTYPKDKSKTQVFFLSSICRTDIVT